jgi:hypothetical protein
MVALSQPDTFLMLNNVPLYGYTTFYSCTIFLAYIKLHKARGFIMTLLYMHIIYFDHIRPFY